MTYSFTRVVDIIEDVVDNVRAAYAPAGEPYFLHGHPLDVVNVLSMKDEDSVFKFKKYPLIILMQDFKEHVDSDERDVTLNLVIVDETKPEYVASERYTNIFVPVLYPLWDLLHEELTKPNAIGTKDLKYDKYDRLYWGKTSIYGNTGNIANDYLDAIEILNLQLHINKICL